MSWLWYILIAIGGYLLGNFSSGSLIARLFGLDDIRKHGSGNPGTTNVLRTLGILPAALTFLGDSLKSAIPAFVGLKLLGPVGGMLGGLCGILGHIWPVFMGFKGGKGVASTYGALFVLDPWLGLTILGIELIIMFVTCYMSVASISATVIYAVLALIFHFGDWYRVVFALILAALCVYCHRSNIARLKSKNENKLDFARILHSSKKK